MHPALASKIKELLTPDFPGWCTLNKANALAEIILEHHPKVILEIGVFAGRSLIPMALAQKHTGIGRTWGIDPWSAVESAKEMDEPNRAWWASLDHDWMYEFFLSKLKEVGVYESVSVIRKRSDEVEWPDMSIDLLHIDGSHSFNAATSDAKLYGPKVSQGGFVIVDDIMWSSHGPEEAINILTNLGFKELSRVVNEDENWAVFQKS